MRLKEVKNTMVKKSKKKSTFAEGELTEPTPVAKEKPAKKEAPAPVVYEKKDITADNVLWALGDIGGAATVNAIRKHLGQPVNPEKEPKVTWAADAIRAVLTKLVEADKVTNVAETRQGQYELL